MKLPQVDSVRAAIGKLAERLNPIAIERIPLAQAMGRVLAEALRADRDSPALDVSAMDGYAIRINDNQNLPLPVQTTVPAGAPPVHLEPGSAIRIFTGAPVPAEAECVVRREDTEESDSSVIIRVPASELQLGQHIRRRGENIRRGDTVIPAGKLMDASTIAAVASFGESHIAVRRKLRVAILNTGDELVQPGEPVADWQIRDSNGPTLQAWLGQLPWVEIVSRSRVEDRFDSVLGELRSKHADCDAIILTGGVSMGDTDFVPAAIQQLGGEIAFHRLPIRPGRPVLGASLEGKLLLGLPGNPVSVAVTARVFGLPLLKALAGSSTSELRPLVQLQAADEKRIDLIWYRLVTIAADGRVCLSQTQGSGDVVSLAQSDGFVELPPGRSGTGPWPLTMW
jgi:molybdopterin molybdotransferase